MVQSFRIGCALVPNPLQGRCAETRRLQMVPISEGEILDQINEAESRMGPGVGLVWEFVRVLPHKWVQHPWGDRGGEFWAVGIFGSRVI